jgi:hypothetical protein
MTKASQKVSTVNGESVHPWYAVLSAPGAGALQCWCENPVTHRSAVSSVVGELKQLSDESSSHHSCSLRPHT